MTAKYDQHTTGSQLVAEYAAHIRDKVLLVKGVSPPGIGHPFVLAMAKASPRLIILAGHNRSTLGATTDNVHDINANIKTRYLIIDLGAFRSIRNASEEVNSWSDVPNIDVVVKNAGIMGAPWGKTEVGYEKHFGVNHLGHFLLTNLIMGKILSAPAPRMVSVSSDGHCLNPIRWTDYNLGDGAHYDNWRAYGQSKTANNLFALALATKLGAKGLQAYSIHPGVYLDSALNRFLEWDKDFDTLKAADVVMGTRLITGEFQRKSADKFNATHIYAAFGEDLKTSFRTLTFVK